MKRKAKLVMFSEWNKRFFRLYPGKLVHYVDSSDPRIRDTVPLTYQGEVALSSSNPLCFTVNSGGEKRVLTADSEQCAASWVDAIQDQIDLAYEARMFEGGRGGGYI